MELLIWHEALGCDDEQATEQELLARVLYSYSTSGASAGSGSADDSTPAAAAEATKSDLACLHSLHFVQGLLTFVRMLKRSNDTHGDNGGAADDAESTAETHRPKKKRSEWMSATLSKRKFYIQEVESQVFIALQTLTPCDSNLRQLPDAPASSVLEKQPFADGMELLLAIQSARKRIRKLDISLESFLQSNDQSCDKANTLSRLEEDKASAQAELRDLLELSPAQRLQKRFAAFFPTLLRALDASHASSLHEVVGMGDFPMDQLTFLSLQSFASSFHLELADRVESSAVFYKGNLLWSSIESPTLQLLHRFLKLREENGMEIEVGTHTELKDSAKSNDVWMSDKYRDTFLPIWSSKTSYAECTVVNNARHHPRKAVRSLHKQAPAPLAAVVADVNSYYSGVASDGNPSGYTLSKSGLKARIKSVSYRNTGMLMKNGYFAKTFELPIRSRGRGRFSEREALDFVWMPPVFPLVGEEADETDLPTNLRRAVVWHESDLTMVILAKVSEVHVQNDGDAALVLSTLASIEDVMDKLQFHELAKLILAQYHSSFARGTSSQRSSSASSPPFMYLNRANSTFTARQVPRLIKSKEDDLFPLPLRLLANYFPQQTLDLLNHVHGELQRCGHGENRDVCVKTLHDGWLLGKKSHTTQRELYAFFDTKVPSVADLSDALEELLDDQFGDVFF